MNNEIQDDELVRTIQKQIQSRSFLSKIIGMSINGIYIYDMRLGANIYINPQYTKLTGYTLEDLNQLSSEEFGQLFHEGERQDVFDHMDEVITCPENDFLEIEYRFKKADGGWMWCLSWDAAFNRDSRGQVTQFVGVFIDITEQKQAESALRHSEERYRRLLEANPDPLAVYDNDDRVVYLNPEFTNVFGWTLNDFQTRKTDFFVPGENRYETEIMFRKVKAKEKFSSMESQRYDKKGTLIPVSISGAAYLDQGGRFSGCVINLRDIRHQKQMEIQLRQAQKMEAIGVLAGGIAHDFNNILTSIIGNASLSLMNNHLDGSVKENLDEIGKAAQRGASLTGQLLAFSRKQIIKPRVLNLNELLADINKMLNRLISENIEIDIIPATDLWPVKADAGQIEQVIVNLVVNARDAMPEGGRITIETANVKLPEAYFFDRPDLGQPGDFVRLTLSDTGSGIDKKIQGKIFEPFFTTKEMGRGTGLGLSVIYGIIKQSNGFIRVYSEAGQGTVFKVHLPRAKRAPVTDEKERPAFRDVTGSETILVVEDDARIRKFTQKILVKKGYRVLSAENGEDALMACRTHVGRIDLVITDVIMPRMGGKETAEHLQLLYPKMKVIYMSGYTDNAIGDHGVLASGINFIEKPFTPMELLQRVREELESA